MCVQCEEGCLTLVEVLEPLAVLRERLEHDAAVLSSQIILKGGKAPHSLHEAS